MIYMQSRCQTLIDVLLTSNRLQWAKVGTSCSNKSNIISGIRQGKNLGPNLFVIYINDLPNSPTSQCKMIADNVNITNHLIMT